jgi:hypothetical protein
MISTITAFAIEMVSCGEYAGKTDKKNGHISDILNMRKTEAYQQYIQCTKILCVCIS